MSAAHPRTILSALALTQVVSWGSIYYAFAVVSSDIARDLGLRPGAVFGAFSWSLLVAGLLAPVVGSRLDRVGGRAIMGAGSLLASGGLATLAMAHSTAIYWLAWTVLGAAMAMVLYEAAFATINRELGTGSRKAISTLTLFGGFASTVFWPLTLKLSSLYGWRDTYLIYAALQLLLCAPLHGLLGARARFDVLDAHRAHRAHAAVPGLTLRAALRHPAFWWLACAFAANSFVFSAMSVHLIPLLQRLGHPIATAVVFAALIGPMQVAGRIGEMVYAGRSRPQAVGMLAFAALPVALAALYFLGRAHWAAAGFCLLYGLSNGVVTIVRGTVPQALFGRENYGAISGALSAPSFVFKAAGPVAIAAIVEWPGSPARWADVALSLMLAVSLVSLLAYRAAVRRSVQADPRICPTRV